MGTANCGSFEVVAADCKRSTRGQSFGQAELFLYTRVKTKLQKSQAEESGLPSLFSNTRFYVAGSDPQFSTHMHAYM